MPNIFGIRHLSPAGAWHLIRHLDEVNPELILIEGPSDLSSLIPSICREDTIPPIAIMAYSETVPIKTILYPFAEYSPEYQAILWAYKNNCKCQFIDLPSSVFLAFSNIEKSKATENSKGQEHPNIYQKIADISGEHDQETYWERNFEHNTTYNSYLTLAHEFGKQLRECSMEGRDDQAETIIREAYMKRMIKEAIQSGVDEDKIVVVTGAFHVEGLKTCEPMNDNELKKLPKIPCKNTLMPYSYYRLSSRSGYGAGNRAPAYYELLWNSLNKDDPMGTAYHYFSQIGSYQRKNGNLLSSAEIIEAVRLSTTLAHLKNSNVPTLSDLLDSAITCLGHGNFSEIALAVADTQIGTKMGSLPFGISRTSIQEDFYGLLKDLRLEKYKTMVAEDLELDLRENNRVKSIKAAFFDLSRSFFLHRLSIIGIHFAKYRPIQQENATWAEWWTLQWSPETEIELVETALKGDTIELAVAYAFHERLEQSKTISETALIIEQACLCGMPQSVSQAMSALQGLAIDAAAIGEIADTSFRLSSVIRYGNIRRVNPKPLYPVLEQLFFRACLILPGACICNNTAATDVIESIKKLNEIAINHSQMDQTQWILVLTEISNRDDLNTKASGYATAILLERGEIDNLLLSSQVNRRLSKGIPADLGAGWFEGLAMKNKYALITRLSLWNQLSNYIDTLDDEEFKRALVFLRRAFSNFSPKERGDIAENLGEIWGVNPMDVSEVLMGEASEQEQQLLEELDEFDFDDF